MTDIARKGMPSIRVTVAALIPPLAAAALAIGVRNLIGNAPVWLVIAAAAVAFAALVAVTVACGVWVGRPRRSRAQTAYRQRRDR